MSKIPSDLKKVGESSSLPAVKLKKSSNVKPTSTAYLQVFGSGAGDTSPSVFLFADSQRYVFSCGEATQRLFNEHKLKLGKINNLFLTQLTWRCIGGMPGLLLTLRETGKKSISIHGPPGMSDFLTASECFLYNLDLNCFEYGDGNDGIYKDENIIVMPVPIEGETQGNFSHNSCIDEIIDIKDDAFNKNQSSAGRNCTVKATAQHPINVEQKFSKRMKLDVKPRTVVSYICELVAGPGKMNIKKALELGVPKGVLLGKLQKGEDITLENGTLVKASDVMERSSDSSVFYIIDCPSEYHLKKLQTNNQIMLHEEGNGRTTPMIIIHLTPAKIVQTPAYQDWTERFGDLCQHLFLNSEMCPPKLAVFSQLGIQYCLNQLNPEIFPRLFASDQSKIGITKLCEGNWTTGEPYLKYHLRPTTSSNYDGTDISNKWEALAEKVCEKLQPFGLIDDITQNKIMDSLKNFINPQNDIGVPDGKEKRTLDRSSSSLCDSFKHLDKAFGVVFLGTGASLPSKYRNVSCTLVNISCDKLILLDCGEGSYGQLYRHYGPNLNEILRKLCCVFISHIHADHHLGLLSVLQAWDKYVQSLPVEQRPDPVVVIGPPALLEWLRYYGNFCETVNLRFCDACKFEANDKTQDSCLSSLLESKVSIVPVDHCPQAFGLVLSHRNGWKLVYSGDTRPCHRLINEGRNATVLIHEATLEDKLYTEALAKKHSTTSEAIQCGQKMQAKFTLLNHFSQRYPKIPVFNEEFSDCVGIAFDHMQVNFQNFNQLPKLLQPLKEIFQEEIEEQNLRTESKQSQAN